MPFFLIESAVGFCNLQFFNDSPAGQQLIEQFGSPIAFSNDDLSKMARFLRAFSGHVRVIQSRSLKRSRPKAAWCLTWV
jgi:hypothetical protein